MKIPANNEIYKTIKNRIINMEYKPGEVLSEKALTDEFNVSRTPIRESILKLAQDGLIEIKPRLGTYVSLVDLAHARYAYEVKKNLEGLAAELACQRAEDHEIDELFEIIERIRQYDIVKDYKTCIQEDQRFHQIVRQASRNPILIETLEELNTITARFLQYIRYVIEDDIWFMHSLDEMAVALRNRDREAARKTTEEHTQIFLEQMSRRFFI